MKALIFLALGLSACAQQYPQQTIPGTKTLQSLWNPSPNPTQPAAIPFSYINLTGTAPDVLTQIDTYLQDGTHCPSVINMRGDQDGGTFDLAPVRGAVVECGTTTQEGTYQRLNLNYMELCVGSTCGLYD